ncbi:substrate-binding domain-containing protein [Cohnella sp. AR92]|uniref:substrate-binding domain-containing protein n=1 Tax=Cohnella sp. AR92 TaxID=648716 RepID=UPI000F8F2B17|nr:substrate-binding domain-containing protein [Cohnella sp. AR92]RUS47744.1 sugar ABC transporter substrate-binding protein [Cohnella sp. AR92]
MSNRIWNVTLLLLACAFLTLLILFAFSAGHTRDLALQLRPESAAEHPPLRVALISQELNNPFWRSIEEGARASAQRNGMTVEYAGPLRNNAEEQIRLMEKAVASGADALILQGLGDPAYAKLIDEASERGIPVVTVDADEPTSRRIAYVGTNNRLAGETMGELVVGNSGESGGIGVLLGSEATNQKLRLEGFRSVVGRNPKLSIVDVRISHISRLQAAKQAQEMLLEHPDLKAIVGFSALDGAGIAEAAALTGSSDVRVFAFDDLENTRRAIREDRIEATIVQSPYGMGAKAIDILHDFLQGKKINEMNYSAIRVLDKSALPAEEEGEER